MAPATCCDHRALAERFCDERAVVDFVCRRLSAGLNAKLKSLRLPIHSIASDASPDDDVRQLLEIAAARNATWIVLDGYEFSAAYRRQVYDAGRQVLVVDDMGADDFYHADMIVNPGLDAAQIAYRHPPMAQLLLGPQYAPVGAEFSAWREPRVTPVGRASCWPHSAARDPTDLLRRVFSKPWPCSIARRSKYGSSWGRPIHASMPYAVSATNSESIANWSSTRRAWRVK